MARRNEAILVASGPESGATISVINTAIGKKVYAAPVGASQGSWSSTFPNTSLLDFFS